MTDDNQFTALVLEQDDEHNVSAGMQTLPNDRLPEGDVTVGVEFSTLNYKDGMIVQGLGRMIREYPHVPGIDFAGTVSDGSPFIGQVDHRLADAGNAQQHLFDAADTRRAGHSPDLQRQVLEVPRRGFVG